MLDRNRIICGECRGLDGSHKMSCDSRGKMARTRGNIENDPRPNPSTLYVGPQPYYGALGDCPVRDPLPDLTRNAVKCLKCNTVIESKHRHDFVSCPCGNISVDGGLEYQRRVGTLKDYEEMSEYIGKETDEK